MPELEADLTVEQAVNMAVGMHKSGQIDQAEAVLRQVIDNFGDDNFDCQVHLGNVLADKNQYYEALYRYDRALKLDRRNPLALSNRGMVMGELKHYEESLVDLRLAAHHSPDNHVIWNNIGNTLIFMRRYPEAITALRKALSIEPMHLMSHYNLGVAYLRSGNHEHGIIELERALAISPDYHEARFNLGLAQLCLGDFENGFRNYESRWLTVEYAGYHKQFPQPKWVGDPPDLTGKSLILYGDQGLGDSIHFCRYLPMFVATGAKVYGVAHGPLHSLFSDTFPDVEWLPKGAALPSIDYRCSYPSAPFTFKTKPETVPQPIPFALSAEILRKWWSFFDFDQKLKVGVVWSGNWKHDNDASRSIAFKRFRHLFDRIEGASFYSLQYEVRPVDQDEVDRCKDLIPVPLKSFADTCAAVKCLDLVITVDTSVAHVAGTMGTPTWMLIPTPRVDWRWLLKGSESAWYPSMRIYRQEREGDWEGVFKRVRADLRSLIPTSALATCAAN